VLRALGLIALAAASPLRAQLAAPRSASYLFSANVEDARALWINPAGLGVLPIASIYAEVAADRPATGEGRDTGGWAAESRWGVAWLWERP
jgi:hypothetical protein